MVELTEKEVRLYMKIDRKINQRAYEIAESFNLCGGQFDSVYVSDDEDSSPQKIIIEMGEMSHGEYCPTTHYLTVEEFCSENGEKLFKKRIQKEYEERMKCTSFRGKVYKVNFD